MSNKTQRIVVKPAGYGVIVGTALVAVSLWYARQAGAGTASIQNESLDPTLWKFEVRPGVEASTNGAGLDAEALPAPASRDSFKHRYGDRAAFKLSTRDGITVSVRKTDGRPDSVYLRNGLNYDHLRASSSVFLRFRLSGPSSAPALVVLREGTAVRWSKEVKLDAGGMDYRFAVPMGGFKASQGVLAFQLGAQPGRFELRDVQLAEEKG